MGGMDESLRDCVGLEVRHRQVGAILRQAEENRDLVLEQACHDPDGDIYHDEVRVEIRLETLSHGAGRCKCAPAPSVCEVLSLCWLLQVCFCFCEALEDSHSRSAGDLLV